MSVYLSPDWDDPPERLAPWAKNQEIAELRQRVQELEARQRELVEALEEAQFALIDARNVLIDLRPYAGEKRHAVDRSASSIAAIGRVLAAQPPSREGVASE